MDCSRIHELLDAWLAGSLAADQAGAFRTHLDGCAECADVVAVLSGSEGSSLSDDQVVRPVVAATTGRGCSRVHEILAGDAGSEAREMVWAREHAAGCAHCERVASVLEELPGILPTFASVDPGPDFTAEVLLATLDKPSLWDVFVTRVGDYLRRWQQRQAFAQELSYALTLALVLFTVIPGSPMQGLPRQALSLLQVTSLESEPVELDGTVGGQLRQGMRARGERLGAGFDRLGTHVIGAGRGLVEGDLEEVGENAGQIGCDLQRLWTGVREPAVEPDSICG
jgi:hypothetical protein